MSEAARGHLAMLVFSALVAGSFSLGSLAAPHIAPEALNSVRFVIAAAVLGIAVYLKGGVPSSAFKAPWRYFVLASLLATYFVLMFEGLKTGAPVSMSAVFTLTPVMAAGFGWLLVRQVTSPRMALALTAGAAGSLWVIFRADLAALLRFHVGTGEITYFWGCVSHAVYAPMVRRLNRGDAPLIFTFGTVVAGAVLLVLWSLPELIETQWLSLPSIVWITIIYTALAASAATFVLLQYAALRLPSAKVMAYTYLTPSWVILSEAALGRGWPPFAVLGGVALTVVALVVLLKDESAPNGETSE